MEGHKVSLKMWLQSSREAAAHQTEVGIGSLSIIQVQTEQKVEEENGQKRAMKDKNGISKK